MLEHLLWNTAIVATTVAWIRFCDWKLKPWMEGRQDGYSATLEAIDRVRGLQNARDTIENAYQDDMLTDAEGQRALEAVDKQIADVMARLSRA